MKAAWHNSLTTMNDLHEPMKEYPDDSTLSGKKSYSTALRTSAIGCISSFVLALLAIATLFFEKGDTSGPAFLIFGILAIGALIVFSAIAVFTSLVGITHGVITLTESKNLKKEVTDTIAKNIGLVLGIIVVMAIVFRLLTNW